MAHPIIVPKRTAVKTLISAQDVSVATATVSVKTLVIGNRQMTKNIFNQIVTKPMYDAVRDDHWNAYWVIRGIPWGWINIHRTDCRGKHLHVIWQSGNELYKMAVAPSPYEYEGGEFGEIGNSNDYISPKHQRVISSIERDFSALFFPSDINDEALGLLRPGYNPEAGLHLNRQVEHLPSPIYDKLRDLGQLFIAS